MPKNSKKGFTLVELSIVLVIIGLLIGGILVAQSMINTARLQALVRQIGQFDAAVANFQTKFNGLPGDVNTISACGGTAGLSDGNGLITSTGSATAVATFSGEIGTFWHDLSLSGFSTEGVGTGGNTYVQATSCAAANISIGGVTANIAAAKAGRAGSGVIVFGDNTTKRNYYGIVTTANTGAAAWVDTGATTAAIKPADALALDAKLDDGIANTGNVLGGKIATTPSAAELAACSASGVYAVATTSEQCMPLIRLGVTTGVY